LEPAAEKLEEGSTVARQSVAQAAKVTGNLFAEGVYKSAYWTSCGFVFSAVYLLELFPETNSFRRGLEEGLRMLTPRSMLEKRKSRNPLLPPPVAQKSER